MICGRLALPSLSELRERVQSHKHARGKISVEEVVEDIQTLHTDVTHGGSPFQVASQFNLLEIAHPSITPEAGIGRYESDRTQGPACAIAAGAGTIYRNYFAVVNGQVGQSERNQIDCLADLGSVLGNTEGALWQMRNGYALASPDGLNSISKRLHNSKACQLDGLRGLLRIGVQWNTQVTLNGASHLVSQAYCSALPVAYSGLGAELWESFARVVLEAAYEATICAAILNSRNTGNNRQFLTLLDGGAFGNNIQWIFASIEYVLRKYKDWNVEVKIVSKDKSQAHVRQFIERLS